MYGQVRVYHQPAGDHRNITGEASDDSGHTDTVRIELLEACSTTRVVRCVMIGACKSQERRVAQEQKYMTGGAAFEPMDGVDGHVSAGSANDVDGDGCYRQEHYTVARKRDTKYGEGGVRGHGDDGRSVQTRPEDAFATGECAYVKNGEAT